jgi:hypothetical protein
MKWEELKTPESVLAAFEAGRQVQVILAGHEVDGDALWVTRDGVARALRDGWCYRALIEEPAIPDGFTPWGGGECPEDARGIQTTVLFRDGTTETLDGDSFRWTHHDQRFVSAEFDITAYRVESEQAQDGLTSKQAWWAGARAGLGVAADMPREQVAALLHNQRKSAQPPQQGEAVFWVRWCSDGTYEGPIHDSQMGDIRRRSGAWTKLYTNPLPIPVESLGRAAEGVEGLVSEIIDAQPFTADNDATRVWQLFRDPETVRKHLATIIELVARRLRPQEPAGLIGKTVTVGRPQVDEAPVARPLSEWHEDHGDGVWFTWRDGRWLGEPAWIGTPIDSDWPGYHTHYLPHPQFPAALTEAGHE